MLEVFANVKEIGLEMIAAKDSATKGSPSSTPHWVTLMEMIPLEQTCKFTNLKAMPLLENSTILRTVLPVVTTPPNGTKPISTVNAPTRESVTDLLALASASLDLRVRVANVFLAQMTVVERDNVFFSLLRMIHTQLGTLTKLSDASVTQDIPAQTAL